MWKELLSAVKQLLVLTEKTEQNKESIANIQSNLENLEAKVERLTNAIQLLANDNLRIKEEVKNKSDSEAKARENLALKLENEMLKFEKRLPTGKPEEEK